ncbi:type II secretion system protein F [Aeromicrobium flavum]|uniref:Type II secretion system protein F n=1 Tax=Aeromicrobium flavum TaxID=416568 RepID=A0A512HYC9_9ACTN|nr:type II secretion system F family protein [Aeromicrobium flavum]GEO90457.1 type II secretion system protein F [Aeromicrobium flavum]
MGTLIGLVFGIGLVLLADNWQPKPESPARPRAPRRIEALLERAGMPDVSPRTIVVAAMGAGLVAAVVAAGITGVAVVGLLAGIAAAWTPLALVRSRAVRRQREHAEAWPDAVDHLASAVRAGLSLPEALIQLGERGPEQLRRPFVQFGRDYGSTGRFAESLDLLKARLADPIGDRVVEALRIAREVGGGDLGRLLRSLSGFLRDDLRTRGELESRQSWTIGAARLAVAAPWLVLLMMSLQRELIARFATPSGVLLLVAGAAICLVAYRLMLRLGRLPTEQRILA